MKKYTKKHFRKEDKQVELRGTVKGHMRLLARLYMIFRDQEGVSISHGNSMDLFIRVNFDFLYHVYDQRTVNKMNKLKPGLVINLYDVLIDAANTWRYHHYENGKDDAASEIEKFLVILGGNKENFTGSARYQIEKS